MSELTRLLLRSMTPFTRTMTGKVSVGRVRLRQPRGHDAHLHQAADHTSPESMPLGDGRGAPGGEHWACTLGTRAGVRARAVFPTKQEAMEFAERHARSMPWTGLPLKWEDTGQSLAVRTVLGEYLVAPEAKPRTL
jgi:hypothetical protein